VCHIAFRTSTEFIIDSSDSIHQWLTNDKERKLQMIKLTFVFLFERNLFRFFFLISN